MKLTRAQLKQIIREELEVVLTNEEAGELFGPEVQEELEQMEREAQKDIETAERDDARQDVLEENITRKRKGAGRRSLLRASGGGIGFYNEYDK